MGEGTTSATVNTQAKPDSDGQPEGQGSPPSGETRNAKGIAGRLTGIARKVNWLRVLRAVVLVVGLAAVIGGLVLWLNPAEPKRATVKEDTTTTVTDRAGHKNTTKVKKNTQTNTPGVGKSDAMLVAVFTVGVGLLAVGFLWHRIQEFGLGGVTVRLTEAAAEEPEFPLTASTLPLNTLDSTGPAAIAQEVRNLSDDVEVARIDLGNGTFWAPTNLNFYMLLLAYRRKVKALVFTGLKGNELQYYFGVAPVAWLVDKVKSTDPVLFAAYQETAHLPLASESEAGHLGNTFFNILLQKDRQKTDAAAKLDEPAPPPRATGPVDPGWLYDFAEGALITRSIEVDVGQVVSKKEQLEILTFPLRYVPITNHHRSLEMVLDKRRITTNMRFSVATS